MFTRPADNGPDAKVLGMRRSSMFFGTLVSVLAPVTGVMAYQSWAPGPAHALNAPTSTSTPSTGIPGAAPVVRYRPCGHGAQLEDGVCVTHRVRTVVAPASVGAPAAAPVPNPAPTQPSPGTGPGHGAPAHPHDGDPADDQTGDQSDEAAHGPTAGPAHQPTVAPSPPSCEATEDDGDEQEGDEQEGDEDQTSESLSGGVGTQSGDRSEDCDGEDPGEDQQGEDDDGPDDTNVVDDGRSGEAG